MELKNKKWSMEEFLAVRETVLKTWKTGDDPDLDLEKSVAYLKSLPEEKNFGIKLAKAKDSGMTLVQPRAGVALIKDHISLLRTLEKAGADFLPSTIDSYTRQNRYEEAEMGIEESMRAGRSLLNGFPAVNYGVARCKEVQESIGVPLQARHGTPDARLLAEIVHAAGWTSFEGGGISYNIPYAKSIPLEDTIRYWQYVDRLVGFYEEQGVTINREPFGPLTGTLCPPCILNTVQIIEALLAAEQGVKNITVGYGQGGNVVQDIAAVRALEKQTEDYLSYFGYKGVTVTTVFHQWMGGFPKDEAEALGLISMSSTVAALAGATKMITKTPFESIGIPTPEANATGIKASKLVCSLLKDQKFIRSGKYFEEYNQIIKEVDCLLSRIFDMGEGDLAIGVVRAFEQGVIDVPFAPSKYNAGKILPARDNEGCIRILEFGNLGFTHDIKRYHREKLEERSRTEERPVSFQMTVDDVYAVSRGQLIGRPIKK